MKTTTVKELYEYLDGLVQLGKGELPVYFDTEARAFQYHMAKIGKASHEDHDAIGFEFVILSESHE